MITNQYYKIDGKKALCGLKPDFYTYLKENNGVAPVIPEGVEIIGDNLFKEIKELRQIEMPTTCIRMGWHTFLDCSNLEKVIIHEGVREIKGSCFSGCPKITELYIPKTIVEIRENAFKYCTGLKDLNFFDRLHIDNTKPEDNDEQKIRPFANPNKILERIDDTIILKTKDNFYFKSPKKDDFIRVKFSELKENLEDGYIFIKSMKIHRYYDFMERYTALKEAGEKVFLPCAVVMVNAYPGEEDSIIRYGKNLNAIFRQATILKGTDLNHHEKETIFKVAYGMGLYQPDEATRTKGANALKQGYLADYKITRNEDGKEVSREKLNDGLEFEPFMEIFGHFKMKPYNPDFTKVFLNNTLGVEHISKFLQKDIIDQKKISNIFNHFDRIETDYNAYKTTAKGDKEFDLFEYSFNYKDISKFGAVPEDRVELAEKIAPYYNTEQDFKEVCEIVDKSVAPHICLPRNLVREEEVTYMANSIEEPVMVPYTIKADYVEANDKTIAVINDIADKLTDKEQDDEFTFMWSNKTELVECGNDKKYVGNVENLTVNSIIGTCCTLERAGRAILYNLAWGQNTEMILILQNGFPIGKSTFTVNRETGEGLYNNFEISNNVFLSKEQQEQVFDNFYRGTLAMVNTYNEYNDVKITKVNIGTRANKMDLLQFSKNAVGDEWVDPIPVQLPGYPGDAKGQQIIVYNKNIVDKGQRYRNGALVKG